MIHFLHFTIITFHFLFLFVHAGPTPLDWDASKINYPKARRSSVSFSYPSAKLGHNVSVGDPYNYFEQGIDKSKEVKAFVDAENALTKKYLDTDQELPAILTSIGNLNNFSSLGIPKAFGPKNNRQYIYAFLETGNSLATWYIASEKEMQKAYKDQFTTYPGKPWLDENLLNENGTDQVSGMYPSPDGQYIAYGVVIGGTQFRNYVIRKVSTPLIKKPSKYVLGGEGVLSDLLPKGDSNDIFWTVDSKGFFYTELLYPNGDPKFGQGSQVRYHFVGTGYEKDVLIAKQPKDIDLVWSSQMTADGKWITINMNGGVDFHSAVYVASLDQTISNSMKWQSIAPGVDNKMFLYACIGKTFYFATDADNAQNIKIVSIEIDPSRARSVKNDFTELTDKLPMKTVIPEQPNAAITIFDVELFSVVPAFAEDKVIIWITKDAKSVLSIYDLKNGQNIQEILPQGLGTVEKLNCQQFDNECFLMTSTMNKPNTIYRINWIEKKKGSSGFAKVQQIADQGIPGVELNEIVSESFFSTSKDGTKIPFIAFHKKNTKLDGSQPGWLYFYGQYGLTSLPQYRSQYVDFILNYNGVVFWSFPRGGGEEGAKWHLDGMRDNRQNTVDDVLSVAHYVTDNKLIIPGMLVVDGGSAAGTTCMVVTNQAPVGLIGASLCRHGDYDQLRSVTMDASGPANVVEFGDPFNGTDFDHMYPYAPLVNVKKNKPYGSILIFTTANDENVSPAHSLKMIATLQNANPKNKFPLLLYLASQGGHFADHSSRNFIVDTLSYNFAIITHSIGLKRNK